MKCRDVLIIVLPLACIVSCSLNSSVGQPYTNQNLQSSGNRMQEAQRAIDGASRTSHKKRSFWSSNSQEKKKFNLFSKKEKKKLGYNTPTLFINKHPHPHEKTEVVDEAAQMAAKMKPKRTTSRVRYMKKDLDSGMNAGLKPATSHNSHSHGGGSHNHGATTHTHGTQSNMSHPQPQQVRSTRQNPTNMTQPFRSNPTPQTRQPSYTTPGMPSVKVNDQTPALSIEEINQLIDANTFPIQ